MPGFSIRGHEWPGNRIRAVRQPNPFVAIKKNEVLIGGKIIRKEKDMVKDENSDEEGKGEKDPF